MNTPPAAALVQSVALPDEWQQRAGQQRHGLFGRGFDALAGWQPALLRGLQCRCSDGSIASTAAAAVPRAAATLDAGGDFCAGGQHRAPNSAATTFAAPPRMARTTSGPPATTAALTTGHGVRRRHRPKHAGQYPRRQHFNGTCISPSARGVGAGALQLQRVAGRTASRSPTD